MGEKRNDIVMLVKKNAYIHKYKDPFVVKNLDKAMELLNKAMGKRKGYKLGKFYACFVDGEGGEMILPDDLDKYHKYTGAICVTEREIYAYNLDNGVLAPAMVDLLGGLWFSIKNDESLLTDDKGVVYGNKEEKKE